MELLLVHYPRCSTCQRAKAWLEARGISFQTRDIRETPPTAEELRAWREKSGLPLKSFFNTCGVQYRQLGLKDRLAGMDEPAQLALLAGEGMLVKRPLLVGPDFVLVGFREAQWSQRLDQASL